VKFGFILQGDHTQKSLYLDQESCRKNKKPGEININSTLIVSYFEGPAGNHHCLTDFMESTVHTTQVAAASARLPQAQRKA
jgi:hypothetical protein